jgi:hypothetical protein
MKKTLIWLAFLLGALSIGCGGGGGSSAMQAAPRNLESAPAPTEPFNIPSTTLTASSGGNSYTATYSATPNNGTTMFDGQEANSSTISLTIEENGTGVFHEMDTAYYLENPYQPLGMGVLYESPFTHFSVLYNSTNPLPSTLTVGDSGALFDGTSYTGLNPNVGHLFENYSVASNNASTVLLTTNTIGNLYGGEILISETINYAVNASGAFELQSIEIPVRGTTLTFTNSCSGCWDY